ncbi:MAG: hypothetical protein M3505_03735 [Verrucomicrobiota bacterium]|jgi:hypothetical protein|nr:hypothetical protein [Verrucomicrobiota bacterium]
MTTRFTGETDVSASSLPFDSVRRDSVPTRARVGEEMGEFVPQRPIDFGRSVLAQARV